MDVSSLGKTPKTTAEHSFEKCHMTVLLVAQRTKLYRNVGFL
jgi:hypothetical protein